MKELRKLPSTKLMKACMANDWYTEGTNEEYKKLLDYANAIENVTIKELEIIADNIYWHSNFDNSEFLTCKEQIKCNIISILINIYCYSILEY